MKIIYIIVYMARSWLEVKGCLLTVAGQQQHLVDDDVVGVDV